MKPSGSDADLSPAHPAAGLLDARACPSRAARAVLAIGTAATGLVSGGGSA